MAGSHSRRSQKAGLPPGSLVHLGRHTATKARVTLINYDQDHFGIHDLAGAEECAKLINPNMITWINVDGISDAKTLETIGSYFNLHALLIEDVMNTDQRPKLDDYDEHLFLVMRVLAMDHATRELDSDQISLVLGKDYVISFQEKPGDLFRPIMERLSMDKSRIRKNGADYLLYSLIDVIVDNYFVIIESVSDDVEELEVKVLSAARAEVLSTIQKIKKDLIFLRKSIWPLREILTGLERGESDFISAPLLIYFRDIYDHSIHAIDSIETLRDMLSGMLDIYISSVSNRLNEVMKVLTIISTIFIPLTFIAGVYGMNFKNMPEIQSPYGYPASLSLMAIVCLVMLLYFKRKKWF